MNFKNFLILSIYTIWDGLSLKNVSRFVPLMYLRLGFHSRTLNCIKESCETQLWYTVENP
jgi:hypothetical protein